MTRTIEVGQKPKNNTKMSLNIGSGGQKPNLAELSLSPSLFYFIAYIVLLYVVSLSVKNFRSTKGASFRFNDLTKLIVF